MISNGRGDIVANTNITMRIDENLKAQLEDLLSNLGMDMITFFTLAAKKAVREQALPFQPRMVNRNYNKKAYQLAMNNTKYNNAGNAIVEKDSEWRNETEWDDIFDQMKKEKMKAK